MKNTHFSHLAGLGELKAWFSRRLAFFRENSRLAPRAIVLAGLPGTGKRSVANAIAKELRRPLVSFQTERELNPESVALVEDLDREHFSLIRRLADPEVPVPFVIALTEQPWFLPAGLLRPDAVESIWHLDLPDMKERCELWDLATKRWGLANPGFDNVILARASHELTHGEIHAAFVRSMRMSYPKEPREKHLLESLLDIRRLGSSKHEDLARMTAWAARHAISARSA